jgi:hypothetical protein
MNRWFLGHENVLHNSSAAKAHSPINASKCRMVACSPLHLLTFALFIPLPLTSDAGWAVSIEAAFRQLSREFRLC